MKRKKNAPAPCPCGSGRTFDECCGPFLSGAAAALTPEALMRSRYTAYAVGDDAYVLATWDEAPPFSSKRAKRVRNGFCSG